MQVRATATAAACGGSCGAVPDMNTHGKEAACTSARTRTRRRERAARGDMHNESDGLAFGLSNDPDG